MMAFCVWGGKETVNKKIIESANEILVTGKKQPVYFSIHSDYGSDLLKMYIIISLLLQKLRVRKTF